LKTIFAEKKPRPEQEGNKKPVNDPIPEPPPSDAGELIEKEKNKR
jgi:hypothetical protein